MIGSSIESTCTYNLHVHDSEFFVCEGPERIPRNDYICLRGRFRRRGGGGPRHIFDTFNKKINIF